MESIFTAVVWACLAMVGYYIVKKLFESPPPVPENQRPVTTKSVPAQDMSLETLGRYNGKQGLGICVAIKGNIYDVSSKPNFYGPNGPYGSFAGKNITRALAKGSVEMEDIDNNRVDDLTTSELSTLDDWEGSFKAKYPVVGKLL